MAIARINGQIIAWARRRAGADVESLATTSLSPANISGWEKGESYPSEKQAQALAERLGIAYAMLFMASVPPDEPLKIPDLRTLRGAPISRPSLDFLQVLDDTVARQEWYRQERLENDHGPLQFVGKFNLHDDPTVVAADMRRELYLDTEMRMGCRTFEDFLRKFAANAERAGVLVMRSGVVRHSTNRTLQVKEFRGFVLTDPVAPIVFINDDDAKAAQIFTLAHELAHVWIGEDGISDRNPNDKKASKNTIELFCDKVAAELLVPEPEFDAYWRRDRTTDANVRSVAQHFRVSSLVALRKAKDLGKLSLTEFYAKVDEQYDAYKRIERERLEKQKRERKPGGNFWASFEIRNSPAFNTAVAESINTQRISYTEAASLFGVSLKATVSYLKHIGAKP